MDVSDTENKKGESCMRLYSIMKDFLTMKEYLPMEYFMKPWISLETVLGRLTLKSNPKARGTFNVNSLKRMKVLSKESLDKVVALRNARNGLVHGIEYPTTAAMIKMGDDVRSILSQLSDAPQNT